MPFSSAPGPTPSDARRPARRRAFLVAGTLVAAAAFSIVVAQVSGAVVVRDEPGTRLGGDPLEGAAITVDGTAGSESPASDPTTTPLPDPSEDSGGDPSEAPGAGPAGPAPTTDDSPGEVAAPAPIVVDDHGGESGSGKGSSNGSGGGSNGSGGGGSDDSSSSGGK